MAENPYQAPESASYSKSAVIPSADRHYQHKSLHVLSVATVVCIALSSIAGVMISILFR